MMHPLFVPAIKVSSKKMRQRWVALSALSISYSLYTYINTYISVIIEYGKCCPTLCCAASLIDTCSI